MLAWAAEIAVRLHIVGFEQLDFVVLLLGAGDQACHAFEVFVGGTCHSRQLLMPNIHVDLRQGPLRILDALNDAPGQLPPELKRLLVWTALSQIILNHLRESISLRHGVFFCR